jgi:hypothetical protein
VQWHITEKVNAMFIAFSEYTFSAEDVCAVVAIGASKDGHILHHSKGLYRRYQQNNKKIMVWFLAQLSRTY